LVFGSVVVLVAGIALVPRRPVERKRLARLSDGSRVVVSAPTSDESILADTRLSGGARLLTFFAGSQTETKRGRRHPLRQRLVEAGYRRDSAFATLLGARTLLAVVVPTASLAMPATWTLPMFQLISLLGVASLVGYMLPAFFLNHKARARQRHIILGLPDALDLMVVCVEAGLGVNASLSRISKEFADGNPVLSAELQLVTLEIRAGKSNTEALRALADRTGVSDLSALVSMLVQTERFGTSLADALRVQADSMRSQRMQRAEELGSKAPLKMIFPMVLIFGATMMVATIESISSESSPYSCWRSA
jgi:tight adherence protein C